VAELQEQLSGNRERENMTGFVQSLLNATKDDYDQLVTDIDTREEELATYIDTRQK